MSCVVIFPVPEAIVESWGSITDTIIRKNVAFKESDLSDTVDMTEKFFNSLNWSDLQHGNLK